MSTLTIRQGEDCTIVVSGIEDDDGHAVDPTGWSIQAMARPNALSSVLWQEWVSGSPASTQGAAQVVSRQVTPEGGGSPVTAYDVEIDVTHAMSTAWTWAGSIGVLHIEATEPTGEQRRARVGQARIYLDPEAVRP